MNWTKKQLAHFARQCKKWGFDERELWSLYVTIAKYVAPRMKVFAEWNAKNGCPIAMLKRKRPMTATTAEWKAAHKKWEAMTAEMAWAFDFFAHEEERRVKSPKGDNYKAVERDFDRARKGVKLFGEHFADLWD